MSDSSNPKVKMVHLAIGVDFLGSKTSFVSGRNYQIEATSIGIKLNSLSSGREVIIPYPNVKGFELLSNNAEATENRLGATARAKQAMEEAKADLAKRGIKVKEQPFVPQLSEEDQIANAQEARKQARLAAKATAEKALEEQRTK